MNSSLLLEIGTEEIPARFIKEGLTLLKDNTSTIFNENRIGFSNIATYATPRRLAVVVKGVPAVQSNTVKEVLGPAKKIAFDEKGNPTRAAIGFANSQGIDITGLTSRATDKGEYLFAVIEQKGAETIDVMPEVLKKIILSLHFHKSMRWGNSNLRFVRPIHWILAILDKDIIPFEIDGIRSGNVTRGHRFLSPGSFVIREISSYGSLLEKSYVIVDTDERKNLITEGISKLAASIGASPVVDDDLIDTVTNLIEYPMPVLCEFPINYLKLPKELLITVMRDHQKYFALADLNKDLTNYYVVISNSKKENSETIKKGSERVIKARFEDAKFYYEDDIKKTLYAKIDDLKRVAFHDSLGTIHDKTQRLVSLSSYISEIICPAKTEQAKRAAELCKADLITGVVGEFSELQGTMGKYYALHDGEDPEIAEAIMEQYLPAYSGDRIPASDLGAVISLSDKLDNIVSFFSIGLCPTGSEDPFALRRQAIGIVAILIGKGFGLQLGELIKKAAQNQRNKKSSVCAEVLSFFTQRIETMFAAQDYGYDMVQSVLRFAGDSKLTDLRDRLDALSKFKTESSYNSLLLSLKRVNNIVAPQEIKTTIGTTKKKLLYVIEEERLYSETLKIKPVMHDLITSGKFYEALTLLMTMIEPINNFFDNVLVMDKNEEIRLNRLGLLKEIWKIALTAADFSKLMENEPS